MAQEEALKHDLITRDGNENVHRLHDELADWMVRNITVKRNNADLKKTIDKIKELRERYQHISLDDRGSLMNQTYTFANQFGPMLELALVMTEARSCGMSPAALIISPISRNAMIRTG